METFISRLFLILVVSITLTGCSIKKENSLSGMERIKALREEAGGWDSGRYLFTDLDTGDMNQAFSFMYEPDGSQTYLYERVKDGNYYAEYCGGGRLYVLDGENVSVYNLDSDGYESYNKENPHPYSTGDLLFYENLFVRSSGESSDAEGNVTYLYSYDTDKMNKALGTSLTSFITTYTFDAEGNFLYFTQSNSDGANSVSYRIDTLNVNTIEEIENPALAE